MVGFACKEEKERDKCTGDFQVVQLDLRVIREGFRLYGSEISREMRW